MIKMFFLNLLTEIYFVNENLHFNFIEMHESSDVVFFSDYILIFLNKKWCRAFVVETRDLIF